VTLERLAVEHPRWRRGVLGAGCAGLASYLIWRGIDAERPVRVLGVAALAAVAGAASAFLMSTIDRKLYARDPARAIFVGSWLGAVAAAAGAVIGGLLWRADVELGVPVTAFAFGFVSVAAFRYPVHTGDGASSGRPWEGK
jgi:hypothetical protein